MTRILGIFVLQSRKESGLQEGSHKYGYYGPEDANSERVAVQTEFPPTEEGN